MSTIEDVLSYWFGDLQSSDYPQSRPALWFGKSPETDATIKERFLDSWQAAGRGELDDWDASGRGLLAHVLVLDQFSRNMFRDSPGMYTFDHLAQDLVIQAIVDGRDRQLLPLERSFLYMPLMHAENRALQRLGVRVYAALRAEATPADRKAYEMNHDYAVQHADIVERFGRFPHRNGILGRESTAEEVAFLKEPGSSF
jgi:uncharacterized protein (DUF924 family)